MIQKNGRKEVLNPDANLLFKDTTANLTKFFTKTMPVTSGWYEWIWNQEIYFESEHFNYPRKRPECGKFRDTIRMNYLLPAGVKKKKNND